MLGKIVALLALAASCLVIGVPSSLAASKSDTAATTKAGWYDTDPNAAHSRANPAEKVLSAAAVTKVKYLRSVVSPPTSPRAPCGPQDIAAPLPYGGSLYAITDGKLSKYNPATGKLIWRRTRPSLLPRLTASCTWTSAPRSTQRPARSSPRSGDRLSSPPSRQLPLP
jgi:hypothetical protein